MLGNLRQGGQILLGPWRMEKMLLLMMCAPVHSGCLKKTAQTRWLGNNRRFYFSHFWSLGNPRSRRQQGHVWSGPFSCLMCPHVGDGARGLSESLFHENNNPIHESSTLMTQAPPKGPIVLIPSSLGLGFQRVNLGGVVDGPNHTDHSSIESSFSSFHTR